MKTLYIRNDVKIVKKLRRRYRDLNAIDLVIMGNYTLSFFKYIAPTQIAHNQSLCRGYDVVSVTHIIKDEENR